MNQLATVIGSILLVIGVVIFVGLLLSLPVMLLWNYCLVGAVAGVNTIGWLQAWGILILCGFLFKPTISSKS